LINPIAIPASTISRGVASSAAIVEDIIRLLYEALEHAVLATTHAAYLQNVVGFVARLPILLIGAMNARGRDLFETIVLPSMWAWQG